MIPKIIHYCWFSYSEIPGLAKKWLWHRLWNEDNFDLIPKKL